MLKAPVIVQHIVNGFFRMVRTNSYAFSAVYAPFTYYVCLSVTNSDCLGWAPFYAVYTALAQITVQGYRMSICTVRDVSPPNMTAWHLRHPIYYFMPCLMFCFKETICSNKKFTVKKPSFLYECPRPPPTECQIHRHIFSYWSDPCPPQSPASEPHPLRLNIPRS